MLEFVLSIFYAYFLYNQFAHNQTLSENRANSVKSYLQSVGVTANITTNGYGESRPVATNETAEGKQLNRRVEIIIPVL